MPMLPVFRSPGIRRLLPFAAVLTMGLSWSPDAWAESEHWSEGIDSVMYEDPPLEFPDPILCFSPALKPLWRNALESQEADLRRQAAATIVWAHRRGMSDLQELVGPLTRNLTQDRRLVVRIASAEALVALDSRDSADDLFRQSRVDGLDMAQTVEPALGQWGSAAIRDQWRARLSDATIDGRRRLIAIRGLGELGDKPALPDLIRIARDGSQTPQLRLAAGDSAGSIGPERQEALATELADRGARTGPVDRLVSAKLLRWHSSPQAQTLLIRLAQDDQSSVAVIALNRLLELDPALVLPFAEPSLTKGDVNVRRAVVKALVACPSETTLTVLGDLLADPNPDLRIFVRRSLVTLAESPDLRHQVIGQGERMLDDDRWQASEQSMKLLVSLEHKARVRRFLDLLKNERDEVFVTAAWALRKSAVDETLEPMLEFARKQSEKRSVMMSEPSMGGGRDQQLAQIFQFFGQKKYTPAGPLLRTYVPKNFDLIESRGAAIWALGYLHEGEPDAALVPALEQRIRDIDGMFTEVDVVRRFSAISLGRMKAREAMPTLELFGEFDGVGTHVGFACAWSVQQITGRTFKPPTAPIQMYTDFFLEPLDTEEE